ncbi:hypothetical protein HZH68_003768 [Vespula germanica]|uniref:Uncharacterized protein n=3 Tax=Vespula TaxID=7451 RepID=A0A834NPR3_VESGE|nr:hypothetical protein HZH66_003379 [Vespula vulgaris]KAF7415279.1 hypothetical protein HZH68_003768 [Vespula germanica]KAF7435981.1 hypothetical protein H0235_004172 [Vespula pensylvanica]
MEMFGLTLTGYGNYFTETLNKDYQEPVILPNIKEILEERLRRHKNRSFSEVYNKLDPILGTTDGFSYGSNERMYLQRKKGLWKPVGPTDMYRIPTTRAQEIGFWTKDSLLSEANWFKSTKNYGQRYSEMTNIFHKLRLADPLAVL